MAPAALHALAAATARDALQAYTAFLLEGGPGSLKGKVSEKGVLQALFDIRLLVDVLAGGSGKGKGLGAGVTGHAAWASEAAAAAVSSAEACSAALVEELDPIDWATYEAFLWRNEQRAYQRCAVLLGRGLHSSTFPLNLSALHGIGVARRCCVVRMKGVLGGARGCVGCILVSDAAQVELRSGRV